MQMPPLPRRLRFTIGLALPLAVSSCGVLPSGACNYESRNVTAEGRVIENGAEIARAIAGVGGTRGSSNHRSFSWSIVSVPLHGHVVSVALTDASRPGVVLHELPFHDHIHPATTSGALAQPDNAPTPALGGLYEIVASDLAVLEVRTSLASYPVLRIPLIATVQGDWYRANCF